MSIPSIFLIVGLVIAVVALIFGIMEGYFDQKERAELVPA